jgi:REP element-mobilizing transposase RayT
VKKRYKRRSIRLPDYVYSRSGAYFITICTYNKELILGEIVDGKIQLSEIGITVKEYLEEIPNHIENVFIDEYVIMPNHIHVIIIIVGVQNFEPLQNKYQKIIPKSIGSIIRTFKAVVTNWCKNNGHNNFNWQRNYYEHVIRNDEDLFRIREYIRNNPLKWEIDEENPNRYLKKKT